MNGVLSTHYRPIVHSRLRAPQDTAPVAKHLLTVLVQIDAVHQNE